MTAIVPAASVCFGILEVQAQGPPEVPSPNPGTSSVIPLQVSGTEGTSPAKIAPPWSKSVPVTGALPPLPMSQAGPSPQAAVIQPSRQSPDFVSMGGNRALVRLRNPFEGDLPYAPSFLGGGKSTPSMPASAAPGYGTAPGMAPGEGAAPGAMAGGGTAGAAGQPTTPSGAMPDSGGATPPGAAAAAAADAMGAGAGAAEAAGPTFGGTLASAGGLFPMIGDQSSIRFLPLADRGVPSPVAPPRPPRPPSPRASSVFYPSARNFKITENMSPRPQDRIFYNFNYYDNLNATVNRALQVPITNIKAYRSIWGFEKTFNEGKGSLGLRLPLNTVTADSAGSQYSTPTTSALGNLSVFGKYILEENKQTGSLISIGLAITPPTGPQRFAGSPYLYGLNTTYVQPFLGWIWNSGRFYMQGFSAFDFPATTNDVSMMYNDIGVGYFLVRSQDPDAFLTSMAPVFEVHVNTPLNHRDPYSRFDIAGTADAVNLTYGLNFGIRNTAVLTTALITPVASPKPFDLEWSLLLNIYFGRTRANPLAQIPPVVQ